MAMMPPEKPMHPLHAAAQKDRAAKRTAAQACLAANCKPTQAK
jgi:hypothetical protein